MIEQPYRLSSGGLIDRNQAIDFVYNETNYKGYAGDTLASALLANGEHVLARSFKYHRPRGVFSAGAEEPSALLTVGYRARREPNTQATIQPLYQGLVASSQNCWPSPRFDVGAVNSLLAPFFSAGFYYKTFMWPGLKGWMQYEKIIRKAAGMGEASRNPDPDRYEKSHGFCDVLVVGAGPAGLMAARAAAQGGARVWLVDEQGRMGGQLNRETDIIDGMPAAQWASETVEVLRLNPRVKLLNYATVFGAYDGQTLGIVERCGADQFKPETRQRLWLLRATQVVLATGSIERPLVFGNNDRPGVMQANAVRGYNNQYGVLCGRNTLVFANNNSAYQTAIDLTQSGQKVAAVVDSRAQADVALLAKLAELGIRHISGAAVQDINGKLSITGAQLVACSDNRALERIDCDCVAVSGGWSPNVQLHSMIGSKPVYDDSNLCFLPGELPAGYRSVGACVGEFALQACLQQGNDAGLAAAKAAGYGSGESAVPEAGEHTEAATEALWQVAQGKGKAFVDLQHDVAASDIELAHREGYQSVEHLKRYTTLGMAGDQGRSSNLNALALMAQHRGESIPAVGTTTFRPPVSPVALGVFGGLERGQHFRPYRRSAMQAWHEARGAVLQEVGLWRRPQYYPIGGETLDEAYRRETAHVRSKVGMVDVSSLGKIQINGPDSAEFLNRIYVNNWLKLPIGKARYGVMLREDGIALDDGTTSRWGEHDYLMTTTTANAGPVMTHMEHLLQVTWPDLRVRISSVTEQWAGMAVAGPLSRAVLQGCVTDLDLSNEAFPFMAVGEGKIDEVPVRVLRISFSGEMAYEVYAPADYGQGVWEAIMRAGEIHDIIPYGTETLGALRIEKGHVTGNEIDGRTTLGDMGMAGMANPKKDFIGRVLMNREGLQDSTRPVLTGFKSVDPQQPLQAGAILVDTASPEAGVDKQGHISSVTYSPELDGNIALGFLRHARERVGERLFAAYPLRDSVVEVEVCDPC
ncbi:MAG: sarcosine oxidase subunit alpha family protein, partial [Granulosicoccaceae bacterium]